MNTLDNSHMERIQEFLDKNPGDLVITRNEFSWEFHLIGKNFPVGLSLHTDSLDFATGLADLSNLVYKEQNPQ